MEQSRRFAPFEEKRHPCTSSRPDGLTIRQARREDAAAVARLWADREGVDPAAVVDAIRKSIESARSDEAAVELDSSRDSRPSHSRSHNSEEGFIRGGSSGASPEACVLVADSEAGILGYGRARYLHEPLGPGADASPAGWYLTGVVVDPRFRRRGVGSQLTGARLRWISQRSCCAYYFANVRNLASIALHRRFGFVEIARGPAFAGVAFTGGEGILFRTDLIAPA